MDILELMEKRHSVRRYLDKPLTEEQLQALRAETDACNAESGLRIQLITDEPKALGGIKGKVSAFRGAVNYFAMVGPDEKLLNEKCGWYGERLVLKAQELGLNTCWVALTASKRKAAAEIAKGEKMPVLISLGYGATQDRKSVV